MERNVSKLSLMLILGLMVAMLLLLYGEDQWVFAQEKSKKETIKLPPPRYESNVSIEKALLERRSIRSYKQEPLTLNEISQILWAALGITEPKRGLRTYPSSRRLFLLQGHVLPGNVTNLPKGIYKYQPQGHQLIKTADGDKKAELFKAVGQASIRDAAVVLVISGITEKTQKPNRRVLEAGHAAQNVYLQACSLNLGTVVMAGFIEEEVRKVLNLPEEEVPFYIMPIGKK